MQATTYEHNSYEWGLRQTTFFSVLLPAVCVVDVFYLAARRVADDEVIAVVVIGDDDDDDVDDLIVLPSFRLQTVALRCVISSK